MCSEDSEIRRDQRIMAGVNKGMVSVKNECGMGGRRISRGLGVE